MNSPLIGTAYKRFRATGPFDVIVVGSGIGGLGTAATLAKAAGLRVLVLERHYTAGGFTHVFHRPGFEWDVGVHYVGQVHRRDSQPAALFDYLTEGRLSWNAMPEVYDRVDIDELSFDYVSGRRQAVVPPLRCQHRSEFTAHTKVIKDLCRRVPRETHERRTKAAAQWRRHQRWQHLLA
jgi:phytoene dehydrogenase-like protein